MSFIQSDNTNDQITKSTKRKNQKVDPKKNVKENLKEMEINDKNSEFLHHKFKIISLSLGYIINTFFYFFFIHIFSLIIDKFIYFFSKISEYDYNDNLVIGSIKITVILSIWYIYFSGGYDGDLFFHFFKNKMKLINKKEALVTFFSSLMGTFLYIIAKNIMNGKNVDLDLSKIIVEYIQKKKFHKSKSFLVAFIYPIVPNFLKKTIMNILIYSCPYIIVGNKYIDRFFINNMELYSSVIMDIYLSEFICSFLNYVMLYIYLFTKNNLSYPIQTNLIFTQLIFLFSNESSHIVGAPFMSLNWIINDCILKKQKIIILFFLTFFHYLGYKLASVILKTPHLTLSDAIDYYQNIDQDILENNLDKKGKVNISLIPNEHIKYSNIADTYLGRFFLKYFNLYLFKLSNKKNN